MLLEKGMPQCFFMLYSVNPLQVFSLVSLFLMILCLLVAKYDNTSQLGEYFPRLLTTYFHVNVL
jgi:hypothetical protein